MQLKSLLTIISLLALLSACNNESQKGEIANSRPNILFILVDDLGKEWISAYGASDISTPNIDALAKSGMLFNNVYSMPQCTPSRLTLLTGQYPFRHGWVNHWDVPRWGGGAHFDERTYPNLSLKIKAAGYKTCIAGKWQIDDFRVEKDAVRKVGFDEFCMWTGYETGIPESAERYQNPYIFTQDGSKTYPNDFGPDVLKDFIIDFIKRNKEEPMFIYYPMVLPHVPLVDTPDEQADTDLGKHKAMVRYTDKILGEIVESLEETKIRDNTLIVWTTDNGTAGKITGTYQGRKVKGGKSKTTEPGICAPFIVSWPDQIESNQTSDALIDFTDLFPTFLDIAGYTFQNLEEGHVIDGKSFKDVLMGKSKKSKREWILGMGGGNHARLTDKGVENQYVFRDRVIRNERYKLYINSQRKPEKFIDLWEDPLELNNLLDSLNTASRRDNYSKLENVIKDFPERDQDPIYRPNAPQAWDVEITAKSQVWKK
ncbi:MAG: sulfatase-like hydrolase/transferase [Bacteroidota bacterium]